MAEELTTEEKRALAAERLGVKPSENAGGKSGENGGEQKKPEETTEVKQEENKPEETAKPEGQEGKKEEEKKVEPKPTLSDQEIFTLMSEKTGRKITSWDELKAAETEDDKKKKQADRDAEKLTYGLQKGLFNKDQYESFIADSRNPKDLVYAKELAEAKKDDPNLDEADFKDEFNEKFGIDLDPSSSKHKRGQRQLNMIAEQYLKSEYGGIYQLDSAFEKFENTENSRKAEEQKILAAAPVYKEDVTSVLGDFKKVEFDFNGEKFEVPISEEIIKSVESVMLDNGFSESQIKAGYDKGKLKEFVKQFVIGQNFEELAHEAAKKYLQKHEKGVRGIPEGKKLQQGEDPYAHLTDKQKQALEFFRGKVESTPVAN